MKSVYAQFSLLLLFAFTVMPLSAVNDGKTVSAKREQLEERYKEKEWLAQKTYRLFNEELKDLTIAAFKQRMEEEKFNKDQIDSLRQLILAPDIKVRDIRDKILYLAERGGEKYGITLWWAYQKNDRPMINQLRALGYDINEVLYLAIINDPDMIFMLLKEGAKLDGQHVDAAIRMSGLEPFDPTITDPKYKKQWNELNKRINRMRNLLPQLIKKVENITSWRDEIGRTLLFNAHDKEIASMLVNAGVDINAQDNRGRTALQGVVRDLLILVRGRFSKKLKTLESTRKDAIELIAYLMQQGADPNIKNKKGESALSIAQKAGLTEVVSILERDKSSGVNKKK